MGSHVAFFPCHMTWIGHNDLMPVLVDHARTRDQIAELACGIVAREGLHSLSMRRIAAEAGASRAIVSTYFRDMRDLVLATFQWVASQQVRQFEAAEAAGLGVEGCVESLLPLDQRRLNDWRVTIAYLGYAAADEELAAIERQRLDGAVVRFERLLIREKGVARSSAAITSYGGTITADRSTRRRS